MPAPPPPPPPPMPPMGRGAGGPPPPPPMPGKAPGGKPSGGAGRGALLSDINKGARLKKVTQVNDRSAPQLGKVSDGPSGPPIGGAPPVPGIAKAPAVPSGLAPPGSGNRARSNSDTGGDGARDSSMMSAAPQLAGLFAGGIPKLRKSGGVNTGADSNSPYLSDPETSRSSAPKPPNAAPKPPGAAPPVPGARPSPSPSIAALRSNLRPASVVSTHSMPDIGAKPKPPPPGKKPHIPPTSSRKASGIAPPPPSSPARAPPVPGSAPPAPPPPPPSHSPSAPPPPPPSSIPSAPPPPPPGAAPRAPSRSTPPPPPPPSAPTSKSYQDDDEYDPYRYSSGPPKVPTNGTPSLAEQAARNAFGRGSPAAPPPPPPPAAPPSAPSVTAPPPPPMSASSRPASQAHIRSMLDPSSYTLTNGGSGSKSGPTSPGMSPGQKSKIVPIHDLRWRFIDESQFPRPREFLGGPKKYRAGRGSSVPLDLNAFE